MDALDPAFSPDDTPSLATSPDSPRATRNESGLKPITRLQSDDRLSRIVPTSHATIDTCYYSQFARTFIQSSYNFCAAKMTVARHGKVEALDRELRETEDWYVRVMHWLNTLHQVEVPIAADRITLDVPSPQAGRLIRSLNQYDRLFVATLQALFARSITADKRHAVLSTASRRIKQVALTCIPDTERFAFDGTLEDVPSESE